MHQGRGRELSRTAPALSLNGYFAVSSRFLMKIIILTSLFATQLALHCLAGLGPLPEIPAHKLDVTQVVSIFQQKMQKTTNYMVLSVDWYKASEFQPRNANASYSPANDHPDEYSWFVTYACQDEFLAKMLQGNDHRQNRRFNSVNVMRIKDDGQMGVFIGVQ
jgi:hypothetical protein